MNVHAAMPGHVLELGHAAFLARCRPDIARFVAVGTRDPAPNAALVLAGPSAVAALPRLARMLADPALRLVACRIHHHPGRVWRLVAELVRRASRAPVVLLDFEDEDFLHPAHWALAVRAHRIFKRELPVDRWRMGRRQAWTSVDEAKLRHDAEARMVVAALRPLPLGLPFGATPFPTMHKTSDIFFAGEVGDGAWARARGLAELRALAEEGFEIDLPDGRLPPDAYARRMASARITWSPAGHGWHCFRHAEASAAGSVPLMPYPTVETAAGFVDGETALFHNPRPGGLTTAARAGLADHGRLARIAAAARAHAIANLTPEAVAAYVLEEALAG